MVQKRERISRIICALLLPFFTCAFQWRLWFIFKPFVWFLFYPTVFFSSRIGGKFSGITSTILSAALVMYIFIPPQLSLSDKSPNNLYSVAVFVLMGLMFSYTHDRLERATRRATEAEHQVRINGLQAERVKVSEDLIRSEERLRLALEATSDALWDWDMRSGIVFRSPRFYELVNRPPYDDASRISIFLSLPSTRMTGPGFYPPYVPISAVRHPPSSSITGWRTGVKKPGGSGSEAAPSNGITTIRRSG